MVISIGNDHRGYKLKQGILKYFDRKNIRYKDFGANSNESSDYPDYGYMVAKSVSTGDTDLGILICSNGIGMSIVANKVKGIRAAFCNTPELSRIVKAHNNVNILVLGEQVSPETTFEIIDAWLNTEFETGGRHERRVKKIHQLTGL